MSYKFTASIIKEGKWYVIKAIELGVVSQGESIESAQRNLEEAVSLYLSKATNLKKKISNTAPLLTTLEVKV